MPDPVCTSLLLLVIPLRKANTARKKTVLNWYNNELYRNSRSTAIETLPIQTLIMSLRVTQKDTQCMYTYSQDTQNKTYSFCLSFQITMYFGYTVYRKACFDLRKAELLTLIASF